MGVFNTHSDNALQHWLGLARPVVHWRGFQAPLYSLMQSGDWNVEMSIVNNAMRFGDEFRLKISPVRNFTIAAPPSSVIGSSDVVTNTFMSVEEVAGYAQYSLEDIGRYTHIMRHDSKGTRIDMELEAKVMFEQGLEKFSNNDIIIRDNYEVADLLRLIKEKQQPEQEAIRKRLLTEEDLKPQVHARILTVV